MFNIFKKKTNNQIGKHLSDLSKYINKSTNNKEDLEDFILILKQIQEINDTKAYGKGSVLKNYTNRKTAIENATGLAIEKYTKKIEELDNANI